MADVRCPMCGKPNPAELETCRYCQARLKPVHLGGPDSPGAETDQPAEGELPNDDQNNALPDWLRSLRRPEDEPGQSGPFETPSEDVPDWLSGLRGQSTGDTSRRLSQPLSSESEDAGPDSFASESSDWLSRIGGTESPAAPTPPQGAPQGAPSSDAAAAPEEEFDWLKSFASDQPTSESTPAPSGNEDTGLPDWLSGAGDSQAEEVDWLKPAASSTPAPASDQDTGLPDWLTGASSSQAEEADWLKPSAGSTPASSPEPDTGLPDWLSGAPSSQDQELDWMKPAEPSAGQSSAKADSDVPDWLSGTSASQEESFDWLAPMAGKPEPDQPTPAQPAEGQLDADNLPDWLSGSSASQPGSVSAGEDLPDWMQPAGQTPPGQPASEPAAEEFSFEDFFTSQHASAQSPASTPPAATGDEFADWLQTEANLPGAESQGPSKAAPTSDETNLEDWLADMNLEETAAAGAPDWLQAQPGVSDQPVEGADLPDWMVTAGETETGAQPGKPGAETEAPEWLSNESLDWLAAERQSSETGRPSSGSAPPFGASALEGDLTWLTDLEPASAQSKTDFGAGSDESEPLGVETPEFKPDRALPSWMSTDPSEPAQGPETAGEGEAGLRPADLPDWLQAMRPVGMAGVASTEDEGQLPGAGPLAGLHNVLPAEPDISLTQKPPIYSTYLEISDLHQSHSELLQSLIAAEGQAQPIPARPAISSLSVLRVAIAVLLAATIFISLLTGFPPTSLPMARPDVAAAIKLVDGLAPDAPVLLAVDYEPGLSGEMDALTGALIEHLAKKSAFITVVSTVPTGPVQAEHLFARARRSPALMANPPRYANLGYIAGGATGLLGFADAPRQMLPLDLSGAQVWSVPPLQNVKALTDFRLVVFATENPDTARAWIEQVRPRMNGTVPMLAVVSAQAEPLVRPYFDASPAQLEGLVGGLLGGSAYDGALGQNGLASQYWGPFSLGMLVAGLLMFMAVLFNLVTSRLSGRKEKAGIEAKR